MSFLKLTKYNKKDQCEVIKLILNIQRNEFGVEINEQDQPDLKQVQGFYQQGNGQFWVARFENQIIGTIALLDIGNQQAAIRKMFVKAEFRGSAYKVAQKLLDELICWSKSRLITGLYLGTIDKYQAALKFYKKNGFTECEKHQLPESFPLITVDNVFFQKSI